MKRCLRFISLSEHCFRFMQPEGSLNDSKSRTEKSRSRRVQGKNQLFLEGEMIREMFHVKGDIFVKFLSEYVSLFSHISEYPILMQRF